MSNIKNIILCAIVLLCMTSCAQSAPVGRTFTDNIEPEERSVDTCDKTYENLCIGFYSDENGSHLKDIIDAMCNSGMNLDQLIVSDSENLSEAMDFFCEHHCDIIIIALEIKMKDLESIAADMNNVQILVLSDEVSEQMNISTYRVNEDDLKPLEMELDQMLKQYQYELPEDTVLYEISYRPVYEEVITVFAELGKMVNAEYHWGIAEQCIVFPFLETERITEIHKEAFRKVIEKYAEESCFIYK